MPKIVIRPVPRTYNFVIDTTEFRCQMEWRDAKGLDPKDVLIYELEQCVQQLKSMPSFRVEVPFRLPPVSPDSFTNPQP